jgi:regulator of protease activity HflC (stomatin/prohibitin superfamily)
LNHIFVLFYLIKLILSKNFKNNIKTILVSKKEEFANFRSGILALDIKRLIRYNLNQQLTNKTKEVRMLAFLFLILVGLILLFVSGIKIVPQQERWVIEMLGRYWETWHEGIHLFIPGLMKLKAVFVAEQETAISVLDGVKIDFVDGSAKVVDGKVFVRIFSPDLPYDAGDNLQATGVWRAAYVAPSDIKGAIKAQIENAVGSYLNRLDLDEGITEQKARFDIWTRLPDVEKQRVDQIIKRWGYEVKSIVIKDFELEPEVVKARGRVHQLEKEAQAATEEQKIRARQTVGVALESLALATGKTVADIQAEINRNPKLKKLWRDEVLRLARERVLVEGKAFTKIELSGGGDLENAIGRLIALLKS